MLAGLYVDVPSPGWWVGGGILAVLLGVAAASPVISRPVVALATVIYRRVYGTVGNLAGQNSLRNPRRTAATASALMIGLALVTTMSILGSSAKASVDKSIEENFYGDLVVSNVIGVPFSPDHRRPDRGDRRRGRSQPAALRQCVVLRRRRGADGRRARLAATRSPTCRWSRGRSQTCATGTVIVSDDRADEDSLALGDDVEMEFPEGKRSLEVVGIYEADNPVLFFPFTTSLDTL